MRAPKSHPTPAQVFGTRVSEARKRREWSQRELADRLHIDRTTLNKIERGVRGDVAISQLFAFAHVLRTSPIHLLTPKTADGEVQITPPPGGVVMKAADARRWIRGLPLPGADRMEWFLDLPRDEQRIALETALTSGMPDLLRALMLDDTSKGVEAYMNALQSMEEDDG